MPTHTPNLHLPPGAVLPDTFDDTVGRIPSDSFVVSRDRYGKAKSHFGELSWDYSAYNFEGGSDGLHFQFWGKRAATPFEYALSIETRAIAFCLIWCREGPPLSTGTLRNYVSVLNATAHYAEGAGLSIGAVYSDRSVLMDFVLTRCSGWLTETLTSLLGLLGKIPSPALGIEVLGRSVVQDLKRMNKVYRSGIKQHPPMPSRIYSIFISGLLSELDAWQAVEANVLEAARQCGMDPRAGRVSEWQEQVTRGRELPPQTFLELSEMLDERAKEFFVARGKSIDTGSLSSIIGHMQSVCKLVIQTFTGMREDEAGSLPYQCLATADSGGATHRLVRGRTTKFAHGLAHMTQWVTNREGHQAIHAAQRIADVVYGVCEAVPDDGEKGRNEYPLFVSAAYLRLAGSLPASDGFSPGLLAFREPPKSCRAIIQEEDLRELEHVDPHRAWRAEEKFKLGEVWTFTSHQLRRSLALFAQRSGLVSLPSLRRQLKHITEEMSRYYAKGSAFAKNFIGDDVKHFGLEWQATQAESSALSYILNVLLTDDVLFGGHGNWVQQRLSKPDGTVLSDRAVTMKRFKAGELAYKETILGGCTNVGACDKVAVRWLHTACIVDNCKNLAGSLKKLNLVISAQEKMVSSLDCASVEFRTEIRDLETLKAVRDRATAGKEMT